MSEPIAKGRIKVDARKALDKLRDHMLVDPHLWACEIARVAIALGATRLAVTWSASDFVVEFDGRALPIAQIAHARDHVLTPRDGADGDALRSLGIGVGAALGIGLDAAFVEVTSGAERVRFERNYVDEAGETEAPSPVAADPQVGVSTRVVLRRRLGLGSITRAITSEVPAEATFLETHVDRTRIALTMNGNAAKRATIPLLTVDLDVPGATRAVLEIVDADTSHEAEVQFYEHGVLLTALVAKPWGLVGLPVRYVVDAPRLPTNASRSQLRSDAELTTRVVGRVLPAFVVALAALRGEKAPTHDVKVNGSADALANALGSIVAQMVVAMRMATPLPGEALALLNVPVVYDAMGRLIALSALRGGSREAPLYVYTGQDPLPVTLAPWLEGVLWKRGLAAERAVADFVTRSADEVILPAMKAVERRTRAMQHAASPPVVTPSEATIHRESFTVEQGPFAGLHGEIAVVNARGRLAKARVFVDERALEEMALPGVRLPLDFALAWPQRIVARFEYDAVARNEDLARALHVALRLGAIAIGLHLRGEPDPELVRLAIAAWAETTRVLKDGAKLGALATLPVWRTNDDRLVAFDAIAAYVSAKGAVCCAKVRTQARDGRLIVAHSDVDLLRMLLPTAVFVPYDDYLARREDLPEAPSALAVMVQRDSLEGFITHGTGRIRVYHGGARIKSDAWTSRYGLVDVVLVDRGAVPKPGELRALWATPLPDLAREERMLVEKTVEAVVEDAIDFDRVRDYVSRSADKIDDDVALRTRLLELPAAQERRGRERMKAQILARGPLDLGARVGGLVRGTASNKRGAISVVLVVDDLPHIELLYSGHPLGTLTRWVYPLDAFIDVVDDELVTEDWSKLSDAGLTWADATVVDAALDLMRKLIDRVDFTDNVPALKLLANMLSESPARAGAVLQQVRWSTVQGRTMKVGDDVSVKVGSNRYEPWQSYGAPSPYDAAAVHLPLSKVGEARRRVLAAAGISIEDVTEPVTRLQALRGRSAQSPPPRLDGEPAHPLLRASLSELGVTLAEGELELFAGDWSQVFKVTKAGVREPVPIALSFPIRVVCRFDGDWVVGIEREIQRAVWQHLRNLVPKGEELPPFARKQLRRIVLAEVPKSDASARVFATTDGLWLSLADLKAQGGELSFTTGQPPFPPVEGAVLCLDDSEGTALSKLFPVKDVTEKLKRIQRGIERRSAPPREAAKLDDVQRAKCLFVVDVDEEGIRGELGFLHPNHASARGIELLHTLRPLCQLPDPEGWPVLAVFDDQVLEPDSSFEGLANPKKDQVRIQSLVRRLVGPNVNRWLNAPGFTLGVIRLPTPFLIRAIKGLPRTPAAIGLFWLPKEWPERPAIEVNAIGVSQIDRVPTIPLAPGLHSRIVPVCGKVWISAGARELPEALKHVMAWVALRLAAHVRAADAAQVERYRWDLALIGAGEPATDPVKELAHDRPDPDLMFVAARRAPQLIDKATGDAPAPAPLPMNVQATVIVAAPAAPEPVDEPAASSSESFFAGLVRRVVELARPPTSLESTPLTRAIADAVRALSLTGDPVLLVRQARRGRPIVYDGTKRELSVNTTHPLVIAAAAKPHGILFLVVAALSEINRELVEVTDAEEVAKLFDLLRANASSAADG